MTATLEHTTSVDLTSKSTRWNPQWGWDCTCGESAPKLYANKGAAGFSATCHVKKATGQPVFTKKEADPERVTHITSSSRRSVLCGAESTAHLIGFTADHATCTDCLQIYRERVAANEAQEGYVLPATLRVAPSDEYAITRHKTFRGRYEGEGSAYEAVLAYRGLPVATVVYYGDGGDVQVDWNDDTPVGNPYAVGPRQQVFLDYVDRWVGKWDAEYDLDWCSEGVLSVLVAEAEAVATLTRMRTKTAVLEADDDPTKMWHTINTRDPIALRAFFAKKGPAVRVWHNGAWTPHREAYV